MAALSSDVLFYGGIAVMVFIALASCVAWLLFHKAKKRLNTKLEAEYGFLHHK